jgi:hypothetical protein
VESVNAVVIDLLKEVMVIAIIHVYANEKRPRSVKAFVSTGVMWSGD